MSWQAQTAVSHTSKQTNLGLFRLLMYLAEGADDNGRVDPAPSQETLATFFNCTDRTIRNRINSLISSGELAQLRAGSGPGTSSAYCITLPMAENGGKNGDNGGKIPETNMGYLSTIADQVVEIKAEILVMKAEIEALKVEKVEGEGGKRSVELSADDPSYDPNNTEEEKKDPPNPPGGKRAAKPKRGYPVYQIPQELDNPEFKAKFEEWVTWRRVELRKPVSNSGAKKTLAELVPFGSAWCVKRINKAISKDWQGLVYDGDIPGSNHNGNGNGRNPPAANQRSYEDIISDAVDEAYEAMNNGIP